MAPSPGFLYGQAVFDFKVTDAGSVAVEEKPGLSRQIQSKAQKYYQPNQAPPQWKDLEKQARIDCGWEDDEEFYEHAATEIAAKAAQFSATSVSLGLKRGMGVPPISRKP